MGVVKDLTGSIFGRLTVIERDREKEKMSKGRDAHWKCRCSCGNTVTVSSPNLKNKNTKSCGCLAKEVSKMNKKQNKYDLSGDYGIGYTDKNEEFYFDLEDYEKIKNHCWYLDESKYVVTRQNGKLVLLHRLVMKAEKREIVDHIFGVNYDNRKSQLRFVTRSQNSQNSKTPKNNSSGRKGVLFHNQNKTWGYEIWFQNNRERKYGFKTFEDAVKAREEAEIRLHGKYRSYEFRKDDK